MGWIKTHALILLLAVLATLGPATVTLFFWWRDARDEAAELAARVEQIIEAEE